MSKGAHTLCLPLEQNIRIRHRSGSVTLPIYLTARSFKLCSYAISFCRNFFSNTSWWCGILPFGVKMIRQVCVCVVCACVVYVCRVCGSRVSCVYVGMCVVYACIVTRYVKKILIQLDSQLVNLMVCSNLHARTHRVNWSCRWYCCLCRVRQRW